MRAILTLLALYCAHFSVGQSVVINELQPANRGTLITESGEHADWIELASKAGRSIDLDGYVLSLGARSHTISGPLLLEPGDHLVLWCDGRIEEGPDHLAIKLPREGGTLLLIAPDRRTILDLFTWPTLPVDVSLGRAPGTKGSWCLYTAPTPGSPNGPDTGIRSIAQAPQLSINAGTVTAREATPGAVRFTLDGRPPRASDPALPDAMELSTGTVLRARAYPESALPGAEAMITRPTRTEDRGFISIAAWDADLYDPVTGILDTGPAANFSRSGKDWQVPALVELDLAGERSLLPLGLAVAGSGSRGLPKRSFKLLARKRFGSTELIQVPEQGAWDEALLRADAGPNAYLRNVFMDQVVRRSGTRVDIQQGRPYPLYLNGAYQGLYRLLPPKNGDRFMPADGDGAIDLVEGPAAKALRGRSDNYLKAVDALRAGAPQDSIGALMDLNSLIDLACFDLYSGRADHDLNVRAWRPRTTTGRWRWMLFDMDLWSPPTENSVERMCFATATEAPYLPSLLAHPTLAPRLIARLEALLLTALSPAEGQALADSIAAADRDALWRDHSHWADRLERPSPDQALAALREHLSKRPVSLIDHLAEHTRAGQATVSFEKPPTEQGVLLIEDLDLRADQVKGRLLKNVPLHVVAVAAGGWEFAGWKGLSHTSPVLDVVPGRIDRVSPQFRKAVLRP